ncbi:MAG TPA: 16S rRNA (adenine(1518)-N(6)/adenine(1519)-N(6))-dimethyltransferase RsmA [Lacibacter sp.]|nr:16S rRNA (adenine(1518)-N(6)/adenine(1519)-N(6))-dimethyltransferase RsmA [Lacibacter sp.]
MQYTLKKSLGQHFLRDENICRKIVEAVAAEHPSRLLEVGPGGGALTRHLLDLPAVEFKAIELDEEKVQYLLHMYPQLAGKLVHRNFLEAEPPFDAPFMVVGNFPYNISSQILFKVLEWKSQVTSVVGMFQKEVAQRVAAREGSKTYGILSVLVQAFFEVDYLFDVSEQCFVPPPKVKSGVIRLRPAAVVPDMKSEAAFFLLVKTAFNQRRKMLRNGVKGLFDATTLQDPLFSKRAEQLSVQQFAALTYLMK